MKIVIATTAALLAASSFAFAADNGNNGKNDGGKYQTTTGSTDTGASDLEKQECREGTSGGAPCDERGTTMPTDVRL